MKVVFERKAPTGDKVQFHTEYADDMDFGAVLAATEAQIAALERRKWKVSKYEGSGRPGGAPDASKQPLGKLDVSADKSRLIINWRYSKTDEAIIAEMARHKRLLDTLTPDYRDRKLHSTPEQSLAEDKRSHWSVPANAVIGAALVYPGFEQTPAFKALLAEAHPVEVQLHGEDVYFEADAHMAQLMESAASQLNLTPEETEFCALSAQRGGSDRVGKTHVWAACKNYANKALDWGDNPRWDWRNDWAAWVNWRYDAKPEEIETVLSDFIAAANADKKLRTRYEARKFVILAWPM